MRPRPARARFGPANAREGLHMLNRLRDPMSYANVVASLALFVALGGTAWAAATITGAEVVDESLTGADIKGADGAQDKAAVNGTITGADIAGQGHNPLNGTPFI